MRIAFLVSEFPKLSESFILDQMIGMAALGHEVRVFSESDPGESVIHSRSLRFIDRKTVEYYSPQRKSAKITYLVRLLMSNVSAIGALLRVFGIGRVKLAIKALYLYNAIRKERYDIIHCHFGRNGLMAAFLKEMGIAGIYISTFYGYDLTQSNAQAKGFYDSLFARTDRIFAITENFRNRLLQLGCPEEKIQIHHMGIQLDSFPFRERRIGPEGVIRILTAGRLTEKKGHAYALQALARLAGKGYPIRYQVAGDGPLRGKLEMLAAHLGISERVDFTGSFSQDDIRSVYEGAHIFLLPSVTASDGDQEGMPVVLMEAQASGMPIVATQHSGIPEVVADGIAGFLTPEKNIEALVDRLAYLIDNSKDWPRIGRAGRLFVESQFDIAKLNLQMNEHYRKLAGKS